jgi:CDP-diacylglycerol--glycerol-3-phosphate 3-phosphatidyltransferase
LNLPNTITLCRLLLIPVFLVLWWTQFYLTATAVFFIASATDLLDGHIARARNQETKLGTLLDPLVDKILVTTGFIMLVEMQILPGWAVVLILTREFLVTGLRTVLLDKGVLLSAGPLGKLKTLLQIAAICTIYLSLSLEQHQSLHSQITSQIGHGVFWLAFIITLASGVQYALKGKLLLENVDKKQADKSLENTKDQLTKSSVDTLPEDSARIEV